MMDIGIAFIAPDGYVGKTKHHRVARLCTMLLHVTVHIAWTVRLHRTSLLSSEKQLKSCTK